MSFETMKGLTMTHSYKFCKWHISLNHYRIGYVFLRFGLLCALAYFAQHYCDFIMMFIMRFGLLHAFG